LSNKAEKEIALLRSHQIALKQAVSQVRQRKSTKNDTKDPKPSTPQPQPDEFEPSNTFIIVKGILILVVFFILHSLWQNYVFNPLFRAEHNIDYDAITAKVKTYLQFLLTTLAMSTRL
jgi:hypothetical protein